MTNIIPRMETVFDMKAKMTITYDGEKFDPFEEGDEVSMMIVKKYIAEYSFEYKDENIIVLEFA